MKQIDGADDTFKRLTADVRYHRQRYDPYRARAYALRPTTEARLRELQRACESAELRLAAAKARAAGQESASSRAP